jgi:hypothetical protein
MWRYRLRKLRSIPAAEVRDLVVSQVALLYALLLVRTRPRGKLLEAGGAAGPVGALSPDESERARRLSLAVQRAGEHGLFRPSCLTRSVALQRMLWRSGIWQARIRIGVRYRDGGEFFAHAWVECGDLVLGDQPHHVRSFDPLGDVHLLSR